MELAIIKIYTIFVLKTRMNIAAVISANKEIGLISKKIILGRPSTQ